MVGIVGFRKERPITFSASAELLAGAGFNEDLSRLPADNTSFIPKGVLDSRATMRQTAIGKPV